MVSNNKVCSWGVKFNLKNPVRVKSVKNSDDIKLKIKDNKIHEIDIITPEMTKIEALLYSETVSNKIRDCLSILIGIPIDTVITNIWEISDKHVKEGEAYLKAEAIIARLIDFDLTNERIKKIINNENPKLSRQLSHFRRAISSNDIIEKIREYYQVLEDENKNLIQEYKIIRHLLNHPILTCPNTVEQSKKLIGKNYFDPSSPADLNILKQYLNKMKVLSEKIIMEKIYA